jgi:hypothetical protein
VTKPPFFFLSLFFHTFWPFIETETFVGPLLDIPPRAKRIGKKKEKKKEKKRVIQLAK